MPVIYTNYLIKSCLFMSSGVGGEFKGLCFFWNISLHRNEMCNPERITSLIRQHIPDAKLTAKSEEKLVYSLPLERTNRFSGNLLSDHMEYSQKSKTVLIRFLSVGFNILTKIIIHKYTVSRCQCDEVC